MSGAGSDFTTALPIVKHVDPIRGGSCSSEKILIDEDFSEPWDRRKANGEELASFVTAWNTQEARIVHSKEHPDAAASRLVR